MLGDRHFHVVSAGESERSGGGAHAFRYSAFEPDQDVVEFVPSSQSHAYGAVPRKRPGTGQHQIAHSGKSRQGLAPASARNGQARDLRDAAGDQRSVAVESQSQPCHDTRGNGNHVF